MNGQPHPSTTLLLLLQSLLELVANEMAAEGCRDNEALQVDGLGGGLPYPA